MPTSWFSLTFFRSVCQVVISPSNGPVPQAGTDVAAAATPCVKLPKRSVLDFSPSEYLQAPVPLLPLRPLPPPTILTTSTLSCPAAPMPALLPSIWTPSPGHRLLQPWFFFASCCTHTHKRAPARAHTEIGGKFVFVFFRAKSTTTVMSRKQPHGHYGWSPPSAGQPIWTPEVSLELTEDTAAATEKNLKPFRMP